MENGTDYLKDEISKLKKLIKEYHQTGILPKGMSYKNLVMKLQTYRNKQIRNSKKGKRNVG